MNESAAHVRATMSPLVPQTTGMEPKLPHLAGIKAVVFDLYGTLLISAAGGASHEAGAAPEDLPGFEETFWESVRMHQGRRRSAGVEYPEVEIREVWSDLLARYGKPVASPAEIEALALRHECRVNPVWPMPNAVGILKTLRDRGCLLGIISNAQFYTLPVMEGLFGADLDGLGFHPRLRVFSFEIGEGKPSPRLFSLLRDGAADLGVSAPEILYLGNDFHKDVIPARDAGFRTALFAGDARSLRLGGVSAEEAVEIADAVITDLAQVPGLLEKEY